MHKIKKRNGESTLTKEFDNKPNIILSDHSHHNNNFKITSKFDNQIETDLKDIY